MSSSLRILNVIGTLDPAYGGPVEALRHSSNALAQLGHQVSVLTLDPPGTGPLCKIEGRTIAVGPSFGKYRLNLRLKTWLRQHAHEFDAIVVHGIWQYHGYAVRSVARKLNIPYFTFIHGALDPWFRKEYPVKHLKKRLYWSLVEHRNLRVAKAALFTCEEEKALAGKSFQFSAISQAVVDIGIARPEERVTQTLAAFYSAFPLLSGKRCILLMGRIHSKKGLDLLIEAFAQVSAQDSLLHLVIAGPDEDGTKARYVAQAEGLGIDHRITWTGMLTGDMRWGAYHAAEVFCLPSHSENFGLVVAEALSRSVPVLISNKVNIWREIASANAGFVAEDTVEGTVSLLQRWLSLTEDQRADMRRCAAMCYESNFEVLGAARRFVSMIERLR